MTDSDAPQADEQPDPQKLGKAAGEAFVTVAKAMLESSNVVRVDPGTVVELLRWAYPNGLQDERSGRQ